MPFLMMVQTGKYWVSGYLSLFLRGICIWKPSISIAFVFKMGGGVRENVICFLIVRLPDAPKNIRVFWKLFVQHLKTEIVAHHDGGLEARRTSCFAMVFFDVIRPGGRQWRNQ